MHISALRRLKLTIQKVYFGSFFSAQILLKFYLGRFVLSLAAIQMSISCNSQIEPTPPLSAQTFLRSIRNGNRVLGDLIYSRGVTTQVMYLLKLTTLTLHPGRGTSR